MADTPRPTDAELLKELAPLVRVVTAAMQETPITLGNPRGSADLAAMIAVRVAAYVGREVLPPPDAETKKLRLRARIAETELLTLRAGIRSLGGDPTIIQNLWAQISLRNRQWRDAKQERDQAQAAIERVRAAIDIPSLPRSEADRVLSRVRAALDGTERTPEPSC